MSVNFNPILPCEQFALVNADIAMPTSRVEPSIISAKWKNTAKDEDISFAAVDEIVCIEVKTTDFSNGEKVTIEIKEDKKDAVVLKSLEVETSINEAITDTEGDNAITIEKEWINKKLIINVTSDKTELFKGKTIQISCCSSSIVKGNEGELIKEINIKLSGFAEKGVPLPQKLFTEETENAVKQFQRDYMKVEQTGVICKHFLEKLDEFCDEYYMKIETDTDFKVKCPCLTTTDPKGEIHKCTDGFGRGRSSLETPQKKGGEKPGIHRSLLWALSAMKFYLDKVETADGIKFEKFSSAYRCIADNIREGRDSTNHMGNALDIKFSGTTGSYTNRADKVRELFAIYCGAHIRWTKAKSQFCLEPSSASYYDTKKEKKDDPNNPGKKIEVEVRAKDEFTATTWVHIDCRVFDEKKYQKDEFYCKTESALKGISFIEGNLIETSDCGKYKNIGNCSHKGDEKEKRERIEFVWLGVIKDAYLLNHSNLNGNQKWTVTLTKIPSKENTDLGKPRIQEVVEILEEKDEQYKIKPRGFSDKGWIDKKYIRQICKYEKEG